MKQKSNGEELAEFAQNFYINVDINTIEYYGKKLSFKVKNDEKAFIQLASNIFEIEKILGSKYEIDLKKSKHINSYIFFKYEDYFNRYTEYQNNFNTSNILILDKNNFNLKITDESFSNEKALIFNYPYYRELIQFLKDDSLFATLQDTSQLIIVSKENGVFHIGFKYNELGLKDIEELKPKLENLKRLFEKKEFVQFFKENILSVGLHQKNRDARLMELIKHLDIILALTEKDYEYYVLNFSFEKIKAKFKEERNKYFENLDKNIDIINKQVISLPLTFAATAFAAYQVKDRMWIIFMIMAAYIIYTIIALLALNISKYNLNCLKEDVENEENYIRNNYKKNYNDFKNDFSKIKTKISKIKSLADFLKYVLYMLVFGFALFVVIQITSKEKNKNLIQIPVDKINFIQIDTIPTHKNKDVN